jgi:hypothetical protein
MEWNGCPILLIVFKNAEKTFKSQVVSSSYNIAYDENNSMF